MKASLENVISAVECEVEQAIGKNCHSKPELGHSCKALAISVLAMFFSPALYSSRTDSNLGDGESRLAVTHC